MVTQGWLLEGVKAWGVEEGEQKDERHWHSEGFCWHWEGYGRGGQGPGGRKGGQRVYEFLVSWGLGFMGFGVLGFLGSWVLGYCSFGVSEFGVPPPKL